MRVVLIAMLATACSGEPAPEGPADPSPAERAILGLCEIRDASDLRTAETVFHDRSHETLHQLAADVEEVDRSAAADLLTAKQRIEADLAGDELPDGFVADVEDLLAATRAALDVLEVPAPPCPT